MQLKKGHLFIVGITLASATAAYFYLFREECLWPRAGQEMCCEYAWGYPRAVTLDVNADGAIDFYSNLIAPFGAYSSHTAMPVEFWDDENLDGTIDIHALLQNGTIVMLEVDDDSDGRYDRTVIGRDAENYYEKRHRLGLQRIR